MPLNHSRLVYSDDPLRQPGSAQNFSSGTQRVSIRLERKGRAGKTVTIIERLRLPDFELKKLLRDLQRACGTGGTVKNHQLELQGDVREKIKSLLAAQGFLVV